MEPRFYTNKVIDILESGNQMNVIILSLLNYLSDDDVRDWAYVNGIIDDLDGDEEADLKDYLIYYYFIPGKQIWRAEVVDENDNLIDSYDAKTEDDILARIRIIKTDYNVIRVEKRQYKNK